MHAYIHTHVFGVQLSNGISGDKIRQTGSRKSKMAGPRPELLITWLIAELEVNFTSY